MMRVAAIALSLSALCACAPEEIVVATLPTEDAGRSKPDKPRCATNEDCPEDDFCSKRSCSDVGGLCERRPVVCQPDMLAVCGCDGITYFNECMRRAAGISASENGNCGETALTCTHASPCPTGARCARLAGRRSSCMRPEGICWVIPAECPKDPPGDRWIPCAPPTPGTSPSCVDTCRAIESGQASTRVMTCH